MDPPCYSASACASLLPCRLDSIKDAGLSQGQGLSTCCRCLEWWTFEVLVVLAGVLPDADLSVSTMGIAISISTMAYMLPAGLGGGAAAPRLSIY